MIHISLCWFSDMCIPPASGIIFHLSFPPLFYSCLQPSCVNCCVRWYRRYFLYQEKKKQGIHISLGWFSDMCILLGVQWNSTFQIVWFLSVNLGVLIVVLGDIDDISLRFVDICIPPASLTIVHLCMLFDSFLKKNLRHFLLDSFTKWRLPCLRI